MRRSRSPEVLILVAFLLGAAVVLTLAVIFPMSDRAPVRLGYAMIAVALVLAFGTLLFGDRLPRGVLLAEAAVAAALNSLLVAFAATTGGAMVDGVAYAWLMIYVAWVFPRFWAPFAAFIVAGFGVGLLAGGLPGLFTGWVVVGLTVATIGAVVARVSRMVNVDLATDELTGTLNRRGLLAAAERAVARARRRSEDVTLAALDLDDLKQVNDAEGHGAGDDLLRSAGAALSASVRATDVVARIGGDEFGVLLRYTDEEAAEAWCTRLLDSLAVARERGDRAPSCSLGFASVPPADTLAEALAEADRRMYAVKAAKRRTR